MSTPAEIMSVLADTALAFPGYDRNKLRDAAKHYVKALAEFDKPIIQQAADALIQSSRWFPAVSELVTACKAAQLNSSFIRASGRDEIDLLRRTALDLNTERSFGTFDPAEWEALAQRCAAVGYYETANYMREKAGLPLVDYHLDDSALIAHDREYEAAHPFVGEKWWEAEA